MDRKQLNLTVGAIVLFAVLGMAVAYYLSRAGAPETSPAIQGLLWPNPKQLHAFNAVDDNGQGFGLDRLLGKWSFLFFGYTHCPDVCPLTLAVLNQVLRQLDAGADPGKGQVIFVTVDPTRDTPQRLLEYVRYFNKDFIGVGGTAAQVQGLSSQLGVASRMGVKTSAGDYAVEHTASVFLVDPRGRLVSVFSPPLDAGDIVARYRSIRDFIAGQPVS